MIGQTAMTEMKRCFCDTGRRESIMIIRAENIAPHSNDIAPKTVLARSDRRDERTIGR